MMHIPLPRLEDATVTLEGTRGSMSLDCYLACVYLQTNGWTYFVNFYPDDAIKFASQRMVEFARMSQ